MNKFKNLKYFVMFIGYERSGHSLVGALLDAHPNMIISHEYNVFPRLVNRPKITKKELLEGILERSRWHKFDYSDGRCELLVNSDGSYSTKYTYNVPNQYQGTYTNLQVIGDKKGDSTVIEFKKDKSLFYKLEDIIELPIKLIHVTRNPFDNIARMNEKRLDIYFEWVNTVDYIRKNLMFNYIDIKHENIISKPKDTLSDILEFLELSYTQQYLDDCASIIFKKPHKIRKHLSNKAIIEIKKRIKKYDFLRGYNYDD